MDPAPAATTFFDFGLFTGVPQHQTFPHLARRLPSTTMPPSRSPSAFPEGPPVELPATYEFEGRSRSVGEFLTGTDTAVLLVLHDGAVRLERYALTGGPSTHWISFSTAKSFVSALVGIAIHEGHIGGVEDPISDYISVEAGSAYDGVAIRDVLQMSSGARWNEDYADPSSDVFRLSAAMAGVGTLDEFVATMVPENEPGTVCRYNSADTQALGSLLAAATNRSLSDHMHEKLVEPLGMTAPGHWLVDAAGREMAYGGLNLVPHDFAKLGELFRNRGMWQGQRLIPADWVRDSVTAGAAHLAAGRVILNDHTLPLGYGYQWWLPDGDHGEFSAIGVYNQFIYVDPARDVVIVKLSANRAYGTTPDESTNRDIENIAFLRAVARQCE